MVDELPPSRSQNAYADNSARLRHEVGDASTRAGKVVSQLTNSRESLNKSAEINYLWNHFYTRWEKFCLFLTKIFGRRGATWDEVIIADLKERTIAKVAGIAARSFPKASQEESTPLLARVSPITTPASLERLSRVYQEGVQRLKEDWNDPQSELAISVRDSRFEGSLLTGFLGAYKTKHIVKFLELNPLSAPLFGRTPEEKRVNSQRFKSALQELRNGLLAKRSYAELETAVLLKLELALFKALQEIGIDPFTSQK